MAWTYFTAPLADDTPITANQRNELYDVFLERAAAVEGLTGKTFCVPDDIRDSGMLTDLVLCDSGSGAVPMRLLDALGYVLVCFGPPSLVEADSGDASDPSVLGFDTAFDEASFDMTADELFAADPLIDWSGRWNSIRAVLTQLNYPRVLVSSIVRTNKGGAVTVADYPDEDAAWADLTAGFGAGAGDEVASGIQLHHLATYFSGVYNIEDQRLVFHLTVPTLATGLRFGLISDRTTAISFGSSTETISSAYPAFTMETLGVSSGSYDLDLRYPLFDGDGLDDFRPIADETIEFGGGIIGVIYACTPGTTPPCTPLPWTHG